MAIIELASELESNPRDTVGQGRKWLVDFNAGKTQPVSFNRSNYSENGLVCSLAKRIFLF